MAGIEDMPESEKQKARDAMAPLRAQGIVAQDASRIDPPPFTGGPPGEPPPSGSTPPLTPQPSNPVDLSKSNPDEVRAAMASARAVAPQVQAVEGAGPAPPRQDPAVAAKVNERLAGMEKAGYSEADRAKAMTKDDFVR